MDKITNRKINAWLNDFLKKIERKYSPEKIILFGSRAKNENLESSDIDLIIVSKRFKGINFLERIRKVSKEWNGLIAIEPLCYTPEEFEEMKKRISIVREALKYGKIIFDKNRMRPSISTR